MKVCMHRERVKKTSRSPELSPSPADLLSSWEEDRKLVLRGWSLTFIFLATLLVFSVVDGRMAYVHGPYTGFIGLWIDCRRHKCVNVGQFTVCRRLKTIDFIFSFLSIVIAHSRLRQRDCHGLETSLGYIMRHKLRTYSQDLGRRWLGCYRNGRFTFT